MKKYIKLLKKCPLFANIEEDELLRMLTCFNAKVSTYKKNAIVFSEGDPATHVGLLLAGNVQVVRDDYYGNRSIVTVVEAGQLFAEAFACADIQRLPVTVIASTECEVMLIDCKRILSPCSSACKFHSTLINNLLKILANKNLMLNQKIEFTSRRTTREKLMAYLLSQAKKNESGTFYIPFDRQGLADYLGVERSAMSAELSKLCKEGLIETKKNWFRICDNQTDI